ncbi:MAG: 4-alpha-glucanotransferase, partial [Anaerotignum sp.]|nr:4-alpha-glucanotransferase [Anaerotignum sp.]
NPLYDWDKMKRDGYKWWIRRLAAAGNWYDVVRMDHFRGLEAYWRIFVQTFYLYVKNCIRVDFFTC